MWKRFGCSRAEKEIVANKWVFTGVRNSGSVFTSGELEPYEPVSEVP